MKDRLMRLAAFFTLTFATLAVMAAPAAAQGDLLSGQNHFYTVVFRGNGEAIVYARVVINNISDDPIGEFSFAIPKTSPTELVIYQVKLPPVCVNYDYAAPGRPCTQYSDPNYNSQSYSLTGGGSVEYKKISNYNKLGGKYSFRLPTAVDPGKATAIVIAYAAQGYTRYSLGARKFSFETLKVTSRIQQARVSVDVDSDQILKGKRASVNYATSEVITLGLEGTTASGLSSPAMDRAVSAIGSSSSPIFKEAKNLAPDETLTVKGEYADSWLALYWPSLLLVILIAAAILVGIIFLARFLRRRRAHKNASSAPHSSPTSDAAKTMSGFFHPAYAVISLVSMGVTIGLAYLLPKLDSLTRFGNYDPIFGLVLVITILLVFLTAIIGPFVYAGLKYGRKSLLSIILADVFWLVLFLVVYALLFSSGASPRMYNY